MSGWWSLPQAAPILLRHLSAYAELVEQDLAVAQRQFSARLVILAVLSLAALFTLLMICLAVIAAAWDTPHRMLSIYCMIGVFAAILLISLGYLTRINAESQSLLASVRREWAIDRVMLDRFLSRGQHGSAHPDTDRSDDAAQTQGAADG